MNAGAQAWVTTCHWKVFATRTFSADRPVPCRHAPPESTSTASDVRTVTWSTASTVRTSSVCVVSSVPENLPDSLSLTSFCLKLTDWLNTTSRADSSHLTTLPDDITDPCRGKPDGWRLPDRQTCNGFFTCWSGRSVYDRCPSGQRFAKGRCVYDGTCNNGHPYPSKGLRKAVSRQLFKAVM